MSKQTPSKETSTTVSSTLYTDSIHKVEVEVKDPLWAILTQFQKGKTQTIPTERGYQRESL